MSKILIFFIVLFSFQFVLPSPIMCNGQLCNPDCSHCNICNSNNCFSTETKDCFCASQAIPGNIPLANTPQFMFLTFDDNLELLFDNLFQHFYPFFNNDLIKDSMGCHLRPTAYVQNEYSDFSLVAFIDQIGSIGLHSVTHNLDFDSTYDDWLIEFQTGYEDIKALSLVKNINGGRAPNLALTDSYLQTLTNIGMKYDSTATYYYKFDNINKPKAQQLAYWPFTLDFGFPSTSFCEGTCPSNPYPGIWEFPMFGYTQADGIQYVIMDYPYTNYSSFLADFQENFEDVYNSNRAPMGLYFHYGYFQNSEGQLDMTKIQFLNDYFGWVVSQHSNIIFATESMILNWMKNPQPYSSTILLEEFQCPDSSLTPQNSCPNALQKSILCSFPGGTSFNVCSSSCPNQSPGIGVNWTFLDGSPTGKSTNLPLNYDPVNLNGQHWIGLAYIQTVSVSPTFFCGSILINNPSTIIANSFVFTIQLCQSTVVSMASFWGGTSYSLIPSVGMWVYTVLGTSVSVQGSSFYLGGFCANVNDFVPANDMRLSIDLYAGTISWSTSVPNLILYCGNNSCDPGENATNCPQDCNPMVC